MRARLNNRAWWTDKVPLCSAFCQQAAHTPFQYLLLRCTALQGQVAVLIGWEEYGGQRERLSPLCVQSEQRYGALCGPVRAFLPIGSLWLLPCVCVSTVVCAEQSSLRLLSQHWLFCGMCQPLIEAIRGWHTLLSSGFSLFSISPFPLFGFSFFYSFKGPFFLTKYNINTRS